MLCRIEGGRAQFISRNEQDWTGKFARLDEAVTRLPLDQALLDGEVVALESDGISSFQAMQNAQSEGRAGDLIYYVFDVLHLDGFDLMQVPLEQRKEVLPSLIKSTDSGTVRWVEHIVGNGPEFFQQACQVGLEGIICKRRDRPYTLSRGYDWLKVKCVKREEFVIGGFTPPEGARSHFGALLLGYYDSQGNLRYAGRVGTGFTEETLRTLYKKLEKLEQKKSPFVNLSGKTGQARGVHWVKPRLVGQIEFTQWTRDAMLRHPSFQGLREDKPAKEVVRDEPIETAGNGNGSKPEGSDLTMKKAATKTRRPAKKAAPNGRAQKSERTTTATDAAGIQNEIAGVRLTHPEKVLYDEQGITKFDLAAYYAAIADWIMPHVENRPLSLVRCPDGRSKDCFFQKHPGMGTSKVLRRIPVKEKKGMSEYLVADDIAGLVSLVQIGVLEIHLWGSKADDIERPDRLIFDLDPDPAVSWPMVLKGAQRLREFLEDLGLVTFVKTTGGKGLHVVVPITRKQEWDDAKAFCRGVTEAIVRRWPADYTAKMSKAQRTGKVFIDYLRNDRGATSIAAYSTRARAVAPVSVPVDWEELTPKLRSDHFNIKNLPRRLETLKRDPWADLSKTRQSITAAMLKKLRA